MRQENWDNFRIAWQLTQSGTLTRTGKILQMNHTTVLRHINQLEETLGTRLFIRHQWGYQLTDAGKVLAKDMPSIGESFDRLTNRLETIEQSDQGKLRITTMSGHSAVLNEAMKKFREEHPGIQIQIIATEETIPVESGSAHIAIRVGLQPNEPDVIVKKLMPLELNYYAASSYISQYGLPSGHEGYNQHFWAMPSGAKQSIYFVNDVMRHLSNERVIYQSNLFSDLFSVVKQGLAIGPMAKYQALEVPELTCLNVPLYDHEEALWFVYHRDLRGNRRIKSFYDKLVESLRHYQR